MNKLCALLCFLIGGLASGLPNTGFAQGVDGTGDWSGSTRLDIGYPHVGSYVKEGPTIYLEQQFNYRLSQGFSLGVGFGVNVYPAALTYPLYLKGTIHFSSLQTDWNWSHLAGINMGIGELAFFSYRYTTMAGPTLRPGKRLRLHPEIGGTLLLDAWGGGNISLMTGFGISYRISGRTKAVAPISTGRTIPGG